MPVGVTSMRRGSSVLYITYDGILEPLGYSQVLQYLRGLSREFRIVLLSFEKADDWADLARRQAVQSTLRQLGIRWVPLRYHKRPVLPATAYDLAVGLVVAGYLVVRHHVGLTHARSYVAAVIGLALKRLFGIAFLFDMRGFWPDERVEAGLWRAHSRVYQVAKWFERQFLFGADAVVSLTQAGVDTLRESTYRGRPAPPLSVIPTCTDLAAFHPPTVATRPESEPARPFTLGYVGNAGLWYMFDVALSCFAALLELRPDSRLVVVNRGQHEYIYERVRALGLPADQVTVKSADYAGIPAEMREMDAGTSSSGPRLRSGPARRPNWASFWAAGCPVLTNAGVGDVDRILAGGGAGVILQRLDPSDVRAGIGRLLTLVADPQTRARCRRVAEEQFDLQVGIARYREIYARLLRAGRGRGAPATRVGARLAQPER